MPAHRRNRYLLSVVSDCKYHTHTHTRTHVHTHTHTGYIFFVEYQQWRLVSQSASTMKANSMLYNQHNADNVPGCLVIADALC